MQHDLAEVLKDPLRFAKAKAQHVLEDPLAVPGKALSYARYDVVRVMNQLLEAFRVNESVVEKLVAKLMAVPARRFLRTRKVSFLASDHAGPGPCPPAGRHLPEPDPRAVAGRGRASPARSRSRSSGSRSPRRKRLFESARFRRDLGRSSPSLHFPGQARPCRLPRKPAEDRRKTIGFSERVPRWTDSVHPSP